MNFHPLYLLFVKFFNDRINRGEDGYGVISGAVALELLNDLYKKFLLDGSDILPLEKVEVEVKKRYWEAACKYYHDQDSRIKAYKAAYALSLITSN